MRVSGQLAYQKTNNISDRVRLFFALWPPQEQAWALHAWATAAQAVTGGRVAREATIHLTLAFLGEVARERVEDLIEVAQQVRGRRFDLRLDECARWAHNGVVWAGPRELPAALADLAVQLETVLKAGQFRTEKRAFKAHVSLIRRSTGGGVLPPLAPLAWRAEEFVLVRSTLSAAGPAYEVLARFPLAAVSPRGNSG